MHLRYDKSWQKYGKIVGSQSAQANSCASRKVKWRFATCAKSEASSLY
jgi:hypothetical protein